MANILVNNKKYTLLDFELEKDFEESVVENSKMLFGSDSVYIDTKKRFGENDSYHKGIPDGYLLDFSSKKQPQLYFVENELSTHDVYSHISEQLLRFSTIIATAQNKIRKTLLEKIKEDNNILKQIEFYLNESPFSNINDLMDYVVDRKIKIVLVIDEATTDLNLSLGVFKEKPDVVTLKRYANGKDISYFYEPMREEITDFEDVKKKDNGIDVEFDTVICPAFEDGFKHAYIDNDAWWAIRLSQKAREQLKYLAIYEKSPVASIQHLADIDRIEPYKDSGKFIVYLKNKRKIKPITLDKDKRGIAPQASRYTTLNKLMKADKISDLWKN